MFYAIDKLRKLVSEHIAHLPDKQPWDNRKFMEDVQQSLDEMLAIPPLPESFAGARLRAAVRVADADGMLPHRHVIITQDRRLNPSEINLFNVHTIGWASDDHWTGGGSKWRLLFDRAMREMNVRVANLGAPDIE